MLPGILLLCPLKNAGGACSVSGTSKIVDDVDYSNPPITVPLEEQSPFPVKSCASEMRKGIAARGDEMALHSSMEREGAAVP